MNPIDIRKRATIRDNGPEIIYEVNEREYKLSEHMKRAIKEYAKTHFDRGVRHQKEEVLRVLGISDDPDSWI